MTDVESCTKNRWNPQLRGRLRASSRATYEYVLRSSSQVYTFNDGVEQPYLVVECIGRARTTLNEAFDVGVSASTVCSTGTCLFTFYSSITAAAAAAINQPINKKGTSTFRQRGIFEREISTRDFDTLLLLHVLSLCYAIVLRVIEAAPRWLWRIGVGHVPCLRRHHAQCTWIPAATQQARRAFAEHRWLRYQHTEEESQPS